MCGGVEGYVLVDMKLISPAPVRSWTQQLLCHFQNPYKHGKIFFVLDFFYGSLLVYTIFIIVISQLVTLASPQEQQRESYPLRRQPPYYNAELYKVLRQHYKFQDFMWAGSGEGPTSSLDNQDGMAWEDDGASPPERVQIKVTKTMILYKTVLSTVYPVDITPVIVTNRVPATPRIILTSDILISPSFTVGTQESLFTPTVTSTVFVEPTATLPPIKPIDHSERGINDKLSGPVTDPRYWIQTVIKRKRETLPQDSQFQELLQKRLADIYATAFKRQLLKSLQLYEHSRGKGDNVTLRNRRATSLQDDYNFSLEGNDVDMKPVYLLLRGGNAFAKTALNVSVVMMNVSWQEDPEPMVNLKYIVYAEGNPVQGFVAVKELQVVTKDEMQKRLGYDIITKAEALVQPLERNEVDTVGSTTPWVVLILGVVCLMILILVLLAYMMVLKRRNDRVVGQEDRRGEISRGVEEEESIIRPSTGGSTPKESYTSEGRSVSPTPPADVFRRMKSEPKPMPVGTEHLKPQTSGRGDGTVAHAHLVSPDVHASEGSSYHSHSPQLLPSMSQTSGVARKVHRKRRDRQTKFGGRSPQSSLAVPDVYPVKEASEGFVPTRDFGFSGDILKNLDKISMGNLDIYPESEARTPSAEARKIISRPTSHKVKSQDLEVQQGATGDEGGGLHETDRELSEGSFGVGASTEAICKKDVEVQTPTRLKSKHSPRVRTSPRHHRAPKPRSSRLSLLSSECEEAVEFCNLPSPSSEETNPIGRIRKRFHQFLDDAFNVMATNTKKESPTKHPQSAKVTVSHKIRSKSPGRPWTSHVIREESVRKVRPKSSVMDRPIPKPAWTTTSQTQQRKCQSAKLKGRVIEEEIKGDELDEESEESAATSGEISPSTSSTRRTEYQPSFSEPCHSSYIFPRYPTYPEVDVCLDHKTSKDSGRQGTSQTGAIRLADPSVPLIEAIKEEVKRFENVKAHPSSSRQSLKSAKKQ